jgi:hypothetical protein
LSSPVSTDFPETPSGSSYPTNNAQSSGYNVKFYGNTYSVAQGTAPYTSIVQLFPKSFKSNTSPIYLLNVDKYVVS